MTLYLSKLIKKDNFSIIVDLKFNNVEKSQPSVDLNMCVSHSQTTLSFFMWCQEEKEPGNVDFILLQNQQNLGIVDDKEK